MLGINGKEKPSYVEGDKLYFELDDRKHPVVVRGRAVENFIDLWIVEFELGSPSPESYPFSCAMVPHTRLTPREVALTPVLDTLSTNTGAFWAHFGIEPMPYSICDMRACPWRRKAREFGWWETPEQLQTFKNMAGSDDPNDCGVMYSGEVYGTCVWVTSEYTLAILDDGCGNMDACLFSASKRVK